MKNLFKRIILPTVFAILMLAVTPAIAFADNEDGSAITASVTKSANVSTVAPGGEVSYTIEVNITGDNEDDLLYRVSVKDELPVGLEYVQGSLECKDAIDGLKAEASFTEGVLTAQLYNISENGDSKEYNVFPGQSITFTYRAKADTGLADGKILTNTAVVTSDTSDAAKELDSSAVSVTVTAPDKESPSDKSTLDESPKCGDNFLLGWLLELIGITY